MAWFFYLISWCFGHDVEDYLVEGLQDENLNATEKRQRDAILIDIKQLKERFVYPTVVWGQFLDSSLATAPSWLQSFVPLENQCGLVPLLLPRSRNLWELSI
uniref:Uncharacterized protein n=1 Tax=Podarcis muralis TaxID=64176 RepID=A0A670J7Q1_PODMU